MLLVMLLLLELVMMMMVVMTVIERVRATTCVPHNRSTFVAFVSDSVSLVHETFGRRVRE